MAELKPFEYIMRFTPKLDAPKDTTVNWEVKRVREIVRCKDCKYRVVNEHYGEKGYMRLKAFCDLDTGDLFELGRNAEWDDWFCADGERREERPIRSD